MVPTRADQTKPDRIGGDGARACDIVVAGASAGGVEALRKLVERLPDRLGAAVFVLLH